MAHNTAGTKRDRTKKRLCRRLAHCTAFAFFIRRSSPADGRKGYKRDKGS